MSSRAAKSAGVSGRACATAATLTSAPASAVGARSAGSTPPSSTPRSWPNLRRRSEANTARQGCGYGRGFGAMAPTRQARRAHQSTMALILGDHAAACASVTSRRAMPASFLMSGGGGLCAPSAAAATVRGEARGATARRGGTARAAAPAQASVSAWPSQASRLLRTSAAAQHGAQLQRAHRGAHGGRLGGARARRAVPAQRSVPALPAACGLRGALGRRHGRGCGRARAPRERR